jgi:hypothetical protein
MAGLVLAIHAFLRVSPSRGYPGHLAKPASRCPRMTAFGLGSRASRDFRFNCQTATTLQTCVITPVVCGAGAPSCLAFPPPCERACGTPGARRTLGPDANAVFRNAECIRTFGRAGRSARRSACGVFSVACTSAMANGPITKISVPGRRDRVAAKHLSRTHFDLVVRHTVQGSFHPRVGRVLASGSAGADPSCPKTDVPHEPRNAASPASTASHPANVTIAIAPLGGAGRRGI